MSEKKKIILRNTLKINFHNKKLQQQKDEMDVLVGKIVKILEEKLRYQK